MAVNESRSMNRDLIMGATDGKFKTIVPDRGGEVEMTSATMRGMSYRCSTTLWSVRN